MESAHRYHVPVLLLALLREIATHQRLLSLPELQACLSLLSLVAHELLRPPSSSSSSSSLANTPLTPLTTLTTLTPASAPRFPLATHSDSELNGGDSASNEDRGTSPSSPTPQPLSQAPLGLHRQVSESESLADSLQLLAEMKQQAVESYLSFFSECLTQRLCHNSQLSRTPAENSCQQEALLKLCSTACSVLLLMSKLATDSVIGAAPQPWLTTLMSLCKQSCDRHMTFVALEMLLRLLEMHQSLVLHTADLREGSSLTRGFMSQESIHYVTSRHTFLLVNLTTVCCSVSVCDCLVFMYMYHVR